MTLAEGRPHILVINGVNLDLLGRREPEVYGSKTLQEIEAELTAASVGLAQAAGWSGCDLLFFQTNSESDLLAEISTPCDGILINPGAWTHTSLALADRLKGLRVTYVEVHLSNTAARESIRHTSLTAPGAAGCVSGLGAASYQAGLLGLLLALRRAPGTGRKS